jgi:hypothetical protein
MSNRLDWSRIRRATAITFLGWFAMIGFDFFLHAGVLARWYLEPSPFLLPPEQAFALIPLGYLSFLLLTVLLVWLAVRLRIQNGADGLRFGLMLGALTWGAWVLGLLSITTASPELLVGWFVGQTIELGIAGVVVGSALGGRHLGRLSLYVLGLVIVAVGLTVVLQSLGLSPALKVAP